MNDVDGFRQKTFCQDREECGAGKKVVGDGAEMAFWTAFGKFAAL